MLFLYNRFVESNLTHFVAQIKLGECHNSQNERKKNKNYSIVQTFTKRTTILRINGTTPTIYPFISKDVKKCFEAALPSFFGSQMVCRMSILFFTK